MKVKVDIRIELLEGEEKGRIFEEHPIFETESKVTEIGVIERLKMGWSYIHTLGETE